MLKQREHDFKQEHGAWKSPSKSPIGKISPTPISKSGDVSCSAAKTSTTVSSSAHAFGEADQRLGRRRHKETPSKIHDLLKLANKAKLELNEERATQLKNFNAFNLEARYPDYKLSFYKLCTLAFAKEQFAQIEEVYQWLNSLYPTPSSMTSAS